MEFYYDHEIANEVITKLKSNEDSLETVINLINRIDDIKDSNKVAGLFDDIDFIDLSSVVKQLKETNLEGLRNQIEKNSEATLDSDSGMASKVEN